MTTLLGIDPGASGALAVLNGSGLVAVHDMPHHDGVVSGALLARIVEDCYPSAAYVESVHAMPKQGVTSSFKFGRSLGCIDGVLGALRVPVHYVTPAKWKRHFGLNQDKTYSRRKAIETWPERADWFSRVKDSDRAEAALIALFGRETSNTQQPRSIP